MPTKAELEAQITALEAKVLLAINTEYYPYEEVEGERHWDETQYSDYDTEY